MTPRRPELCLPWPKYREQGAPWGPLLVRNISRRAEDLNPQSSLGGVSMAVGLRSALNPRARQQPRPCVLLQRGSKILPEAFLIIQNGPWFGDAPGKSPGYTLHLQGGGPYHNYLTKETRNRHIHMYHKYTAYIRM